LLILKFHAHEPVTYENFYVYMYAAQSYIIHVI